MKLVSIVLSAVMIMGLYSCGGDDKENLDLTFKLTYGNEPLIMFDEYTYPEGNAISFSRVSFYLSNIDVVDKDNNEELVVLSEAEYLDLSTSHRDQANAAEGLTLSLNEYLVKDAGRLFFMLGLSEAQNATVPTEYTSSNPLSQTGEYWPGWESYVFVKIEGEIDLDGDGDLEQGVALHLGSDVAQRSLITKDLGDSNEITLEIDIKKVFEHSNEIYNIAETPEIHTIAEKNAIEAIEFLSEGFINAIEIVN